MLPSTARGTFYVSKSKSEGVSIQHHSSHITSYIFGIILILCNCAPPCSSPKSATVTMRTLIFLAFASALLVRSAFGLEATFTPAEGQGAQDAGGPLPQSQNQRDQLLQLEDAILNSPNPQETLIEVAKANGMQPQDLVDLLQRNRADMEMAAGGGGRSRGSLSDMTSHTLPRRLLSLVLSLFAAMGQCARSNPRLFGIAATALLLTGHVLFQAPRSGVVLSKGAKPLLLSGGHTTMLAPPSRYIDRYMSSRRFGRLLPTNGGKGLAYGGLAGSVLADIEEQLREAGEGASFAKTGRKSKVGMLATAARTVTAEELLPSGGEEGRAALLRDASDVAYEAAAAVLSSRRFGEFAPGGGGSLRFQSQSGSAVMAVRSLGDWGRYGLQPLREAGEEEGKTGASVVYTTLQGGHLDGEIRFSVELVGQSDEGAGEEAAVVVGVSLVVPKKGRRPSKKMAGRIVSLLAESMAKSIATQAKQTMARRSMSRGYRGRMDTGATEKTTIRHQNERKMEEMATDRRRRWQRRNPDGGRFRPSGDRMRSPNNC